MLRRALFRLSRNFAIIARIDHGSLCQRGDSVDDVASRGYLTSMHTVGLKILKNKLSEYVRLAAAGETVVITDRNRVVAELVPHRALRPALTPFRGKGGARRLAHARQTTHNAPLPPRKPIPGLTFEQLMAGVRARPGGSL